MPNQASPVLDLRDPGGTSDFHTKTIHDEVELSQSGQAASGVHGAALAGSSSFGPGATWVPYYNGVNFTLASKEATAVSLCLFTDQDLFSGRITEEIPLDPIANRTGDTWHILLPAINPNLLYAYRVAGPTDETSRFRPDECTIDPYAQHVVSRERWGQLGPDIPYEEGALGLANTWPQHAARLPLPPGDDFDWKGDRPLNLPMEDISVYEMHVRGFTQSPTSGLPEHERGTFRGAVKKLGHVAAMGFKAVELMPPNEFNELEYYQLIPGSADTYRFNFWGYSTVGFFAPMARFSSDPSRVLQEFKEFVKESHRLGMEVYLDVVFNHTAEGNHQGPTLSFRGIDNKVFYMLAPQGEYYNFSGCGNTVNCNHPNTRRFIVDSLKFWVEEMHVDGFRFDLASILTRAHSNWHQTGVGTTKPITPVSPDGQIMPASSGPHCGTPLSDPPLIRMISEDPVLRSTKMIAEAWDCGGLVQVGAFPHYGGRWSEWNGKFRDTVRTFIKGTDGWVSKFASAIVGSPDVYHDNRNDPEDWWANNGGQPWVGNRGPMASVNFITAHDGFTMRDLVSYNEKKNMANGESNRDGEEHNLSWNCGEEGETQNQKVNSLRDRQVRNMMVALLTSQGVPMVLMGDEYGHTKYGNNNTYCHDSELNWFDWEKCERQRSGMVHFVSALLHIRRVHKELRKPLYVGHDSMQWLGAEASGPDWSDESRLLAYSLSHGQERFEWTRHCGRACSDGQCRTAIYIAFNTSHLSKTVSLPDPGSGGQWRLLVDTSMPEPYDALVADIGFNLSKEAVQAAQAQHYPWLRDGIYAMLPYSAIILENTACAHPMTVP